MDGQTKKCVLKKCSCRGKVKRFIVDMSGEKSSRQETACAVLEKARGEDPSL